MLVRQKRYIALMMVCILLASMIILPIGEAKKKPGGVLGALWLAYTTLEDALSGIDRLIAIIIKDLEDMRDALEDINDELLELYPIRDEREEELEDAQDELDKLLEEEEAAKKKKRNAKTRIKTLKREIVQLKSELSRTSPSDSEGRAALESQIEQKESDLSQAKQDVKDADKIIGSWWRGIKMTHYRTVIGDVSSGLTRRVGNLNYRIGNLEQQADNFNAAIKEKEKEQAAEQPRRDKKQIEVDKAREKYNKRKELEDSMNSGNINDQI